MKMKLHKFISFPPKHGHPSRSLKLDLDIRPQITQSGIMCHWDKDLGVFCGEGNIGGEVDGGLSFGG
jgi:hypothetical protein